MTSHLSVISGYSPQEPGLFRPKFSIYTLVSVCFLYAVCCIQCAGSKRCPLHVEGVTKGLLQIIYNACTRKAKHAFSFALPACSTCLPTPSLFNHLFSEVATASDLN